MSDPLRDRRLLDRQLMGLDPRDNISVIPSRGVWQVMRGAVMIDQFVCQIDALGAARRLTEGD